MQDKYNLQLVNKHFFNSTNLYLDERVLHFPIVAQKNILNTIKKN